MATPEPSTAASVTDSPDPGPPSPGPADLGPAGPGQVAGSAAYRGQAGGYDRRTDAFRRWRELVVAPLAVQPGDTVLDVGCGTGLCLPLLQRKVGPSGTIIGDEAHPAMKHTQRWN